MIGKTLGGYRIIEQIGMGGMATVYKAYDASIDRYVAVKTLPQQYSEDERFRARFEREAKAIARLEHLHILPVFAYGEEDGITYMVMRLLETGTLTEYIHYSPPSFFETARLTKQIASALDYAHSLNIIHRDVKPSNVLLDAQKNAFLTDFGIAKIVEATMSLTGTGNILGTPMYMSPEQCMAKSLTPASDQYALAVVTYQMITGTTPYAAETPIAIIQMHMLNAPMELPTIKRPDLPDQAEGVLLKALSHEPEDRYESCTAFADAFTAAIQGADEQTHPLLKLSGRSANPTKPLDELDTAPDDEGISTILGDDAEHAPTLKPRTGVGGISTQFDKAEGVKTSALGTEQQTKPQKKRASWTTGLLTVAVLLILALMALAVLGPYFTDYIENEIGVRSQAMIVIATNTSTPDTEAEVNARVETRVAETAQAQAVQTDAYNRASTQIVATNRAEQTEIAASATDNAPTPTRSNPLLSEATRQLAPTYTPETVAMLPESDIEYRVYNLSKPNEGVQLLPCQWQGTSGDGLCLYDNNGYFMRKLDIADDSIDMENINGGTISPDGRQIAFSAPSIVEPANNNSIYVADIDGNIETVIDSTDENLILPSWSPDGKWIAVHANCALTILSPDGSERRDLISTNGRGCYQFPQWSPDSQHIAVIWTPISEFQGEIERTIRWVELENPNRYRDLDTRMVETNSNQCGSYLESPISPDGRYVGFETIDCEWLMIDVENPDERFVVSNSRNVRPSWWFPYYFPQWGGMQIDASSEANAVEAPASIESALLALSLPDEGMRLGLCMDLVSPCFYSIENHLESEPIAIDTVPIRLNDINSMTVSANGEQVALLARPSNSDPDSRLGQHSLFIYDIPTDTLEEKTVPFETFDSLSWQPQGEWLASTKDCNLVLFNAETMRYTTLHNDRYGCYHEPQWSPDGQTIVAYWTPDADDSISSSAVRLLPVDGGGDYQTMTFIDAYTTDDNECEQTATAFNGDGNVVFFYDTDCQPSLYDLNAESITRLPNGSDFPYWWTAQFVPQWGQASVALNENTVQDLIRMPKFERRVDICPSGARLCIYEGRGFGQLFTDDGLDNHDLYGWAIHPDGDRVVLSADDPNEPTHDLRNALYVVTLEGDTLTTIPADGRNRHTPSFMPDGDWIVHHAECDIATIPTEGGEERILLDGHNERNCYMSAYPSPQGEQLIVVEAEPPHWMVDEYTFRLLLVPFDSPADATILYEEQRTSSDCASFDALFSPDGQVVNFVDADCHSAFIPVQGGDVFTLDDRDGDVWWWKPILYPLWGYEDE